MKIYYLLLFLVWVTIAHFTANCISENILQNTYLYIKFSHMCKNGVRSEFNIKTETDDLRKSSAQM